MDEAKKYWRDKVTNLLQAGAAVFILLVGWAIQNHSRFALLHGGQFIFSPPTKDARNEVYAAVGLISLSVVYAPLLPLATHTIYKKFLNADKDSTDIDSTVLPYSFAMTCALVLSVLTLAFSILITL